MSRTIRLLAILALLLVPAIALAQAVGEEIRLGKDEVHDDNFVAFGNRVEIEGTVKGDVIAAGSDVTVSGKVEGDVLVAGANVTVSGEVGGNVRVAGDRVDISGKMGKNVTVAAQHLSIAEGASVAGSLAFAASSADISAPVGRKLWGAGEAVTVRSTVERGAEFFLGESGTLTLASTAHVKGDLAYTATKEAILDPGATVDGKTLRRDVPSVGPNATLQSIYGRILSLFGALVVGLVIVGLGRRSFVGVRRQLETRFRPTLGWGLLYFILTPIIALLLLFTVIGVPLAIILAATYAVFLYVAKVFVGVALGFFIIRRLRRQPAGTAEPKEPSALLAMVLGVTVIVGLASVPVVGSFVTLFVVVLGLGAVGETIKNALRSERSA